MDDKPQINFSNISGIEDLNAISTQPVSDTPTESGIFGKVASALGATRRFLAPSREETFEDIQQREQQSLIPTGEVVRQIALENSPFSIESQLDDETLDKIASYPEQFTNFLNATTIEPDFGASGVIRRVARKQARPTAARGIWNRFFGPKTDPRINMVRQATDETVENIDVQRIINNAKTTRGVVTGTAKTSGEEAVEKVGKMFNDQQPTIKKAAEDARKKGSKFYNEVRTNWTDRFTPWNNLVKKIETTIGKKVDFKKDPYVAARLYQGVNGKIQNILDELGGNIRKVGKFGSTNQQQLSQYLALRRMEERAARGIKNPQNITQQAAKDGADLLETPVIKEAADGIKQITDDLLDQSLDSGLISRAAYDSIKKNNQNYIPFDVIEHMADDAERGLNTVGGFSVSEQNVVKALQGTDKDVAEPLEALTRKIVNTVRSVERNKVTRKLAELSEMEGVTDVKKVTEDTPLEKGNAIFHVFEDGQRVTYQAPKDVVEVGKGLNAEEADIITRAFGKSSEIFRGGVTTFNIAFQIPNMVIDLADAMLIAKNRINIFDFARGFASAVGKGKLYKQWREDGGAFSTYVSQAKNARLTAKEVSRGTAKKTINTIMNPLRLLEWMGSVAEESNRLAIYSRALRNGEDRMFAAYDSRQATVDFARYGSHMKVANQLVPFLNARLQGSLNLIRVAKERPERLALRMAFLVGAPTIATYLHNRQYPEYYDIDQWEKDANFIIVYGTYKDENGDSKPKYVKIPKGHIGRMFANPTENFMTMQDGIDAQDWDRLAIDTASNFSPVSFARDGEFSSTAALNSVLPPIVKTPVEFNLNRSLFTDQNIVPRRLEDASPENQIDDDTSKLAQDLGQLLGLSPIGLDHYVSGLLGQVGGQFVEVVDLARGESQFIDTDKTTEEKLTKAPITSRFIGMGGSSQSRGGFELVEDLKTEAADRRLEEEAIAKDIYETVSVGGAGLSEILKDYKDQGMLTPGVVRRVKQYRREADQNISSLEAYAKTLPTRERAKYIMQTLNETDPDLRPRLMHDYQKAGLLTTQVKRDLISLGFGL